MVAGQPSWPYRRQHVREQLSVFRPGGGFVFQQVHNILADIHPESVVAMFDAVKEFDRGAK